MTDSGAPKIEEIRFNSADTFLEGILPKWSQIRPLDYSDPWVYRGHHEAEWELLPAAWREDGQNRLAPLKRKLGPNIRKRMSENERLKQRTREFQDAQFEPALQIAAEVFAVRQFCDLADELGLLIPQQHEVFGLDYLIPMLVLLAIPPAFGNQPPLFVDIPFAFAQHHGIPTRYLDWTRDPFAAAFFATEKPQDFVSKSKDICVWAANRAIDGTRELDWVHVPRGQHGYVHAQSGISLFCGDRRLGSTWKSLPEIPMRKFVLPRSESIHLRELLFGLHRTSKAHLMPTLDNVANVTMMKWGW